MYGKIKVLCKSRGISISKLESDLGFSQGSICKWDKSIPSILKAKQVADKLGVTVDDLIEQSTSSKE